jgi:hypothetical protein
LSEAKVMMNKLLGPQGYINNKNKPKAIAPGPGQMGGLDDSIGRGDLGATPSDPGARGSQPPTGQLKKGSMINNNNDYFYGGGGGPREGGRKNLVEGANEDEFWYA